MLCLHTRDYISCRAVSAATRKHAYRVLIDHYVPHSLLHHNRIKGKETAVGSLHVVETVRLRN